MANADVDLKIGASAEGVSAGVDRAKEKLAELGEAAKESGGGFKELAEAITAPFEAIEQIKGSLEGQPGRRRICGQRN
jgi:hypothetical protein